MTNTSICVNESTKKRLAAKSSAGSGVTRERKSAIDAALGKFTDDIDEDVAKKSSFGTSKRGSRHSKRGERKVDPLGASEHSEYSTRSTTRTRTPSKRSSSRQKAQELDEMSENAEYGTQELKGGDDDDDASVGSTRRSRDRSARTGRKKTERERSSSVGPIKKRSASPGPMKKRSASPGPVKKRSSSVGPMQERQGRSRSVGPMSRRGGDNNDSERSGRSTSPGPLQRLSARFLGGNKNRSESPGPMKKRSESPGPMKKRSESPGPMKKRSNSPGALSRRGDRSERGMRSERVSRPGDNSGGLDSMLAKVQGGPKKRGPRSVASAPVQDLKRPERRPSKHISMRASGGSRQPPAKSRSADSADILSTAYEMEARKSHSGATAETHPSSEEYEHSSPSKDRRSAMSKSQVKRSMSTGGSHTKSPSKGSGRNQTSQDMRDELAKQKVKRNHSVVPQTTPMNDGSEREDGDGPERGGGLQRAQSMLLHREMTRRGKSNSLMNLVEYKEEEIHSTSYFASNHVLINRERMKRGLRPLTRNSQMDELARKSAEQMAESNGTNPLKTTYVGNVLRGESIRSIHRSTMQQKQGRERSNLLNPYFQDFGVGTAKGEDGMLYMCQLFSERLELALTDTTSP